MPLHFKSTLYYNDKKSNRDWLFCRIAWFRAFSKAQWLGNPLPTVVKYFVGYFKFISCLCLMFHSWLESCYDQFILRSRLICICVNRFLSVIIFLMLLSTEVSSSLGFNSVWLPVFKWVRFGNITDLDCYLHQSSCFGLRKSLVGLAVTLSLVFLWVCLFHFGYQQEIRLSHSEKRL